MSRFLVVEGKACRLMADRPQAARKRNPAWSSGPGMCHGLGPTFAIRRASGIARQGVLDVGEDQLLVLLLVVQPQDERAPDSFESRVAGPIEKFFHPLVHSSTVAKHLGYRRP